MLDVHHLGTVPYLPIWEKMKYFTQERSNMTVDELWLLQHDPVYTQGQAGKKEHLLNPQNIPVVQSDRGGQVTYHGPGQIVGYILMDIQRRHLGIRTLVCQLEQLLIQVLEDFGISAQSKCGAPGVYVQEKKIASIGLRVKNGCTYHGIALNVSMDLEPFSRINPCGYAQLQMTQIQDFIPNVDIVTVSQSLEKAFLHLF